MKTPLLYSIVPIAPSKTTTCSGSMSRAIRAFSGNCGLGFIRRARAGTAHCVVLCFRMMDDDGCRRLLGRQLKSFGEIHAECFLRWQKLEDGGVVVEIRTRAVSPRVPFAGVDAQLFLDTAMRPLGDRL